MEELLINKVTYEWVPLYDPTDYDLNSSKTETYVKNVRYWCKLSYCIYNKICQEICIFSDIVVMFFYMLLLILTFIASVWCMKGTYLRGHIYVKPMMQLMGVVTVLSMIEIFVIHTGLALIKCIWCGYQFIVINSLYAKYKDERENGHFEQRSSLIKKTSPPNYETITET